MNDNIQIFRCLVDPVFAIDGGTIVGAPEPSFIALPLVAMAVLRVIRKRIGKTEEI